MNTTRTYYSDRIVEQKTSSVKADGTVYLFFSVLVCASLFGWAVVTLLGL